jgi:hypothetical protein
MEPPLKLKKLISKYNLSSNINDRKFYRKYNFRLEVHFTANSYEFVQQLRNQAQENQDKVRRERWCVNYYTSSDVTIANVIEQVIEAGATPHSIAWFPDSLPADTLIRQKPTEWQWGVRLRTGVSKERLHNFIESHVDVISMDKSTEDTLYERLKIGSSLAKRHTSNTTWQTYYRFNDIDSKNLFLFTFAEYLVQENTFIHKPKDKVNIK